MRAWLVAFALLAACGDDSGGGNAQPKPGQPAAQPQAGAGSGSGAKLIPQVHIEERVNCPIKERDEADKKETACDDKNPCGDQRICVDAKKTDPKTDKVTIVGKFCKKPCAEHENIRHVFKERDFAPEQNRDPFQSFLVGQLETAQNNTDNKGEKRTPTERCKDTQWKIPDYSYAELKLVGIVSQGTQRKVLLMAGNKGNIIKRGDCVGKERAFVKEIGASYVTFQLANEVASKDNREPEEHSLELYPKALPIGALPTDETGRTTITPVVPPPAVLPPRGKEPDKGTKPVEAPPTKITPKQ